METSPIILLMDGDIPFADAASDSLRRCGYRVERAASADEGLALVARLDPDLVVTEMLLPGRSGFWVAEALKRQDRTLPVIMVATYGGPAQRQLAHLMGVAEFLPKPVSPNRLTESVRRLCPLGINPPHARPAPKRTADVSQGS